MKTVEEIRGIRESIDAISVCLDGNVSNAIARHTEQLNDNMLIGRAWLGQLLKYKGEPYPYTLDKDIKGEDDIKPAVDKCKVGDGKIYNVSPTGMAALREDLRKICDDIIDIEENVNVQSQSARAMHIAFNHITNARFYAGYILEAIKKRSDVLAEIEALDGEKKLTDEMKERRNTLFKWITADTIEVPEDED